MRIWSLHPRYLDSKGLVALWREALLAQKVLQGQTKGYTRHPQLQRFRARRNPVAAIATYLQHVHADASRRGYHFDHSKIAAGRIRTLMDVTDGQLDYERRLLLHKLKVRDPKRYRELRRLEHLEPHPLFTLVKGAVADWEVR